MTAPPTPATTTTAAAIEALLNPLGYSGIKMGLSRIERLLEALGNPHQSIPCIHVAGSNGKGSVCAYLSTVLTQAGYRVGRYISPHLVHWGERMTIEGQPIADRDLVAMIETVLAVAQSLAQSDAQPDAQPDAQSDAQPDIQPDADLMPTQFEVITAAMWCYFAQQNLDIAVIEVGLGGRLDATNVIAKPLASVIVSISREHANLLGDTLGEIAGEKAGILNAGFPAIVGPLPAEAQAAVMAKTETVGAPITWVSPAVVVGGDAATGLPLVEAGDLQYPLGLPGAVQLTNSAIAIATLQSLRSQGWAIPDQAIQTGMAQTQWPVRLQWLTWAGQALLIDGAHNPDSARVLRNYVDSLPSTQAGKPVHWVVGMMARKEHGAVLRELLRSGDSFQAVPVPDPGTATAEFLAASAQQVCPSLAGAWGREDWRSGLAEAYRLAAITQGVVVLTGSLYLLGDFLAKRSASQFGTPIT